MALQWLNGWRQKPSYTKLGLHDESSHAEVTRKVGGFPMLLTIINFLLTVLTVTVVVVFQGSQGWIRALKPQCTCPFATVDSRYKNPNLNPDIKRIAGYSPLLDEIDLTPQSKVLNGAFHDNTTIFMQDPSPEVDRAWEMFSEDIFLTSWPTVRDSGRSLSKSIHFPPSASGEPGKYIATWDVFHQIHCLNWLRKSVNWEYYYGKHKPEPAYLLHQKHCIHMLLQSLMCSADVDMVTFEWMEGHDLRVEPPESEGNGRNGADEGLGTKVNQASIPAANFNVHKMCRNFSALVEWAKQNKEEDPTETRRKLIVPENVQLNRPEDY